MSTVSAASCRTVLMIDDNPEDRQFWSNALRGYSSHDSILEASTAQQGLAICRNRTVDCVVLDLDLPDASGFKVLFDLVPHRANPQIAVVILTRLQYPALHEMTIHNGAYAGLVKQRTSAEALEKTIREAVAFVDSLPPSADDGPPLS